MAVTTLYFGASSAGLDDGTSWANRKAFVVAGAINTQISAFDFTTNSLLAYVGPGTHTLTTSIATFSGATTPTYRIPCVLQACDSSGNLWVPPDPGWVSPEAAWDATNMPVLATTTNIATINNANVGVRGLAFTASGRSSSVITTSAFIDWCAVTNSTSNTASIGIAGAVGSITNTIVTMSGTAYNAGVTTAAAGDLYANVRIVGNGSASSGNRYGWASTSGVFELSGCTVVNHVGAGIIATATGTGNRLHVFRSTVVNCGGNGISTASTATAHALTVLNSVITGSGTYGVNFTSTGKGNVRNSRLRDNTSGNITGEGNWTTGMDNYTTDSDDATEFVNSGTGDYRIKNTATAVWDKSYGAGDEPAAATFINTRRNTLIGR